MQDEKRLTGERRRRTSPLLQSDLTQVLRAAVPSGGERDYVQNVKGERMQDEKRLTGERRRRKSAMPRVRSLAGLRSFSPLGGGNLAGLQQIKAAKKSDAGLRKFFLPEIIS